MMSLGNPASGLFNLNKDRRAVLSMAVGKAGLAIVLSTYPDKKSAEAAARKIVRANLAACVNIIRLESSIYKWKGELKDVPERLLIIKARSSNYKKIEKAVLASHPYEVPEIIRITVDGGYAPYLEWVGRARGSGLITGPRSKRS
jgi:periplasmic divalent cation tolerance protein